MPKKLKTNHRVELIDSRRNYYQTYEEICSELACEFKQLIAEHKLLQGVEVYHSWDTVEVCVACGKPLEYLPAEPENEIEGNTFCAWCGKIA